MDPRILAILKLIKSAADIAPRSKLNPHADKSRSTVVTTSEPYRQLGIKLTYAKINSCPGIYSYDEAESIFAKLMEEGYILSFDSYEDGIYVPDYYYQIQLPANFLELYDKLIETLNPKKEAKPDFGPKWHDFTSWFMNKVNPNAGYSYVLKHIGISEFQTKQEVCEIANLNHDDYANIISIVQECRSTKDYSKLKKVIGAITLLFKKYLPGLTSKYISPVTNEYVTLEEEINLKLRELEIPEIFSDDKFIPFSAKKIFISQEGEEILELFSTKVKNVAIKTELQTALEDYFSGDPQKQKNATGKLFNDVIEPLAKGHYNEQSQTLSGLGSKLANDLSNKITIDEKLAKKTATQLQSVIQICSEIKHGQVGPKLDSIYNQDFLDYQFYGLLKILRLFLTHLYKQ